MSVNGCELLFDIFFKGEENSKKAFMHELKESCSIINLIWEEKDKSWDIIAYNRFFYSEDGEDVSIDGKVLIR